MRWWRGGWEGAGGGRAPGPSPGVGKAIVRYDATGPLIPNSNPGFRSEAGEAVRAYALLFGSGFAIFALLAIALNFALYVDLSRIAKPPSRWVRGSLFAALAVYLSRRREIGTRGRDSLCLALLASLALSGLCAWLMVHCLESLDKL
jgi:hypothetical protein